MDRRKILSYSAAFGFAGLAGCAAQRTNLGGVRDDVSGLEFGSVVERNIVIDSAQFENRSVRLTTRNTSGDVNYALGDFSGQLAQALRRKGYTISDTDQFGLRFDVNVLHSGQATADMSAQYAFLGAAAGGVAGYRADIRGGTATGMLVGATLGSIIGRNVASNTYVVVAELSIAVAPAGQATGSSTIVFGSSPPLQKDIPSNFRPYRELIRSKIAVYAGGQQLRAASAVPELRRRLVDIVENSV